MMLISEKSTMFESIRLKMIGTMAGGGSFVYEFANQRLHLDDAMIENFGIYPQRLVQGVEDWQSIIAEPISLKRVMEACFLEEGIFELAFSQQHAVRGVRYYESFGEVLYENQRAFLVGCCWDVTDVKLAKDFASQMSDTDLVTGLPSRTVLMKLINQHLQSITSKSSGYGVVCFDLDGFKSVNDIFGHSVGDSLLRAISLRLQAQLNGVEWLFGLGSDDFVLFLPDVDSAHNLTDKVLNIQQQLAQPFIVNGQSFKVSACYGIDMGYAGESCAETLIKRANVAMHNAKLHKRGSWSFYDKALLKTTTEHFLVGQDLFGAIALSKLEVYYQPQFFMNAGCEKISGIEALLRWPHPEQGFINPELIIKVAESNGQILEVDKYVLRRALQDYLALQALGLAPPSLSVNLSIMSLEQIDFAEFFGEWCDVSFLTLEIIESKLIKNLTAVKKKLKCLREKGIKISLDDFGTGYSSLLYLKNLTIDEIKIDRSFISHLTSSPVEITILKTITQMAKSLGLPTVAEGIESQQQLDILNSLGCDYGQGYLCNKALPMNSLVSFLENCQTQV